MKIKRQGINWERYLQIIYLTKELYTIYIDHSQNSHKKTTPVYKDVDILLKKISGWLIGT